LATTEPLTGVTVQDQSDAATGGAQIGNLAKRIAGFTVPRFTSTTTRDAAYSSFVSGGGAMADGMMCTVPVPRTAGSAARGESTTGRVSSQRIVTGLGSGYAIGSGGSAETGLTSGIPALNTFTLYEAGTVAVSASFRAGPGTGAGQCTVKIDGSLIGNVAISRTDGTVPVIGAVALTAGAHTVSLRVDAVGGGANWIDGIVTLTVGIAE
jgi:hypothetical protein